MSLSGDLLTWYDRSARSLPWRGAHDPYRIWLSEIMLQQTQTQTVAGYYARFLGRFPTVEALAAAPEEAVLKLWEGLGYYSRARNLHAAAKRVAEDLNGQFPRDAAGLRALPGIGPYAANAIASIAWGECVPALDGNQARVLSRVLAWEPPLKTPFDLLAPAQALMSPERPGDYNQALMDLGAMVCLPRQPRCEGCPIAPHCRAFAEDAAEDYPRKIPPKAKREEDWCIVIPRHQGQIWVHQRPKGLLGWLYEFAALEGHPGAEALPGLLEEMGFAGPGTPQRLSDSRHVFTHRVWRMQGWLVDCDGAPGGYLPVNRTEMNQLPFPSALRIYREIAEQALAEWEAEDE